jgi:serine/threonine protein kinase
MSIDSEFDFYFDEDGGLILDEDIDTRRSFSTGPPDVAKDMTVLKDKKLRDHYEIVKILGKGAYGTVYKVKSKKDGKIFAAKEFLSRDRAATHLLEIEVMLKYSGECAGYVVEAFKDSFRMYVIMEFFEGSDLYDYIKSHGVVGSDELKPMFIKLYECVKNLHSIGYFHRDIKVENIMRLSDGDYKLIDFGLAVNYRKFMEKEKEEHVEAIRSVVGTPACFNNQILRLKGTKENVVDIWRFNDFWCLIVAFYYLSTGNEIYKNGGNVMSKAKFKNIDAVVFDKGIGPINDMCLDVFKQYKDIFGLIDITSIIDKHISKW